MKRILLSLFILISILNAKEKNEIVFSPLPTKSSFQVLKDFLPLTSYLEKKLSIKIKFKYHTNYADILKGIKDGSIDMAYLGPLPYISLKQEYKNAKPIVTFKEKNGKHNYRCVLAKFKEDKFNTNKKIKIALTQPLSTCGYFMTNILLKKDYDIDLSKNLYKYTMSHENALLSALKGETLIAGAKDSIAQKYDSLGMEIISSSQALPGFTLVVNEKTLSKRSIENIRNTLLNTTDKEYKSWKGKGSFGMVMAKEEDYGDLEVSMELIPKVGNFK